MNKININHIFSAIFILLLLTIIIFPNWGITDDHQTISCKNISQIAEWNMGAVNLGRMPSPHTIEHFILGKIWLNPLLFYVVNLIYALISLLFISRLLLRLFPNKSQFCLLLIILSPAFVECFFRLAPIEKQLFVLINLFIFTFYKFIDSQKKNYLAFALIISFISLFYKEPAFLLYLGFGIIYYFENRFLFIEKKADIYTKLKPNLVFIFFICSTLIFLVIYKTVTYSATLNYNNFFASGDLSSRIYQTFRMIIGYIFSNPFVIIGIPISLLIRIKYWNRINKHFSKSGDIKYLPFYDGLLLGGLFFTLAYIYLGLSGHRYLLPALGFSFIPVLFYISYAFKYQFIKGIKIILSVLFIILFFNSSIIGINHAIQQKVQPYQFQRMLRNLVPHLKEDILKLPNKGKVDIFLPGLDRGAYIESYASLGKFLIFNKIPQDKFDFKSMEELQKRITYDYYKSYFQQYSIYMSEELFYPDKGDYLVLKSKFEKLPQNYNQYFLDNHLKLTDIYPQKKTHYYSIHPPLKPLIKRVLLFLGYPFKSSVTNIQFIKKENICWSIYRVL